MNTKSELKNIYTQNRELSWLRFNERVLEEAADESVPLLERLKFVAIFSSNLDEFFMIRVGSLLDLSLMAPEHKDSKSHKTPAEQLSAIYSAVRPLYEKKNQVYQEIKTNLCDYGVCPLDYADLDKNEEKYIRDYYKSSIKPILAPQVVDTHHPFPHIANKEIHIVTLLKKKTSVILGLLPIPRSLPEVIFLPGSDVRFIRTEKILYEFANSAFGTYEVLEKNCICVTRNADISPEQEPFEFEEDFRSYMKKLLNKRRRLSVVRLEANYSMSEQFIEQFCRIFSITRNHIFYSGNALKMGYAFSLFSRLSPSQQYQLTYPNFTPALTAKVDPTQSILRQIKQRDLLLFYPFESMDTFLQLIKEASTDPNVLSIKVTIYRLAKKARMVDYLCTAAEQGKDVTVVLELRARFDEQNNIDWSEKLEDAGCKIIYGFDEYKVHSKLCLITMKEKSGVSYITHVGTGNYNEKTAELYTDLSLITANSEIGQDAVEFFKNMSIGNVSGDYKQLLVAPLNFKGILLDLIDQEIEKGNKGAVLIKINSLTDLQLIDKLAEASRAGVEVNLIIRGICCLLPKVPGETDNIKIISVVGRFLEHSRIYSFGKGAEQKLFISSGDWMTRSTERRVEVACPVLSSHVKEEINKLLETIWFDNVKARVMLSDGSYVKKVDNHERLDSQQYFLEDYGSKTPVIAPKKEGFFYRVSKMFSKDK